MQLKPQRIGRDLASTLILLPDSVFAKQECNSTINVSAVDGQYRFARHWAKGFAGNAAIEVLLSGAIKLCLSGLSGRPAKAGVSQ